MLDLYDWMVDQKDPGDEDYHVRLTDYEELVPLETSSGVLINSTDVDLYYMGVSIPADTVIYNDQSFSLSTLFDEVGPLDDLDAHPTHRLTERRVAVAGQEGGRAPHSGNDLVQ